MLKMSGEWQEILAISLKHCTVLTSMLLKQPMIVLALNARPCYLRRMPIRAHQGKTTWICLSQSMTKSPLTSSISLNNYLLIMMDRHLKPLDLLDLQFTVLQS